MEKTDRICLGYNTEAPMIKMTGPELSRFCKTKAHSRPQLPRQALEGCCILHSRHEAVLRCVWGKCVLLQKKHTGKEMKGPRMPHPLHILSSLPGLRAVEPHKGALNKREERASGTWTGLHPKFTLGYLDAKRIGRLLC
ncbi:uncharacterized protein LOC144065638 isoform X2 [Stigmatopora argus]